MIYGGCTSDFAVTHAEPAGCSFSPSFNFLFHLHGLQTQQKHRLSRLPTKRLLFFLPESVVLMPTWYWCNKTHPDFYGNSQFFFAVYNIVRVETDPQSSNQWQFFVGKTFWLYTWRKASGWWQYFYNYLGGGKKGKRKGGREEREPLSSFFCCIILYIYVFLPAV